VPEKTKPSPDRLAGYRRGHRAEWLAALYIVAHGERLLARRYRTPSGEIDMITVKRGRVAFIEVKRRKTLAECEASITPRLRTRIHRAADLWLARNPRYQSHELGFDLIFVRPWRRPVRLKNAL
jgi:putative endonuclease